MLGWVLLAGCGPVLDEADWEVVRTLSPMPAVPADPTNAVADDPEAAALGHALFFDAGLSVNGEVSCASCHAPDKGFADGEPLGQGVGTPGRHTPTALNSAWNRWFFWDGRADTAWTQALGPLENPVEHGTNRVAVARHVYTTHRDRFESLFGPMPAMDDPRFPTDARPIPDDVTHPEHLAWEAMDPADQEAVNRVFAGVGKALAAYERKLTQVDAPFDRFVAGDEAAIPVEAQRGLALFVGEANCTLCHSGPELSDREFHDLALDTRDWLPEGEDYGRYQGIVSLRENPFNGAGAYSDDPEAGAARVDRVALTEEQVGQFKTPSLRNVALTAPYMHGGHFATLAETLVFYNELDEEGGVGHREEILVPLGLSDRDIADLEAFLGTLTGAPPDPAWTAPPT